MKCSLVAPIHTRAFTRTCIFSPRHWNESPLSDHPTIRRRYFEVPYDPRAASRLCELVDFESSTKIIPFFSSIFSSLWGSHSISERCFFICFEPIFKACAISQAERILRALCIQEKCESESRYFFLPEIIIFSPSVQFFAILPNQGLLCFWRPKIFMDAPLSK